MPASAPVQTIKLARVYTWRPKAIATLLDMREGRPSYSHGTPIVVSRLDSVRGGFYIVDGNHRAIETALRGDRTILATIDPHVPRIERTGGAYTTWTRDMVRPVDVASRVLVPTCLQCGHGQWVYVLSVLGSRACQRHGHTARIALPSRVWP